MHEEGCCRMLREEFRLRKFGFSHEEPQWFVQFQFGQPRLYLIWRVFWACYHVAWIIVTVVRSWEWAGPDPDQQIKWFIYLTNWCYFVLTVATIVDAIVVCFVYYKKHDIRNGNSNYLPWYMNVNWKLINVANIASITVSLAYWGLVYIPGKYITAVNIATHILNSLYIIVNVLVSGVPVQLLHFYVGIIYAVLYSVFSVAYYADNGTNHNNKPYIYSALDWREPGTAAGYAAAVAFILCPLVHLFVFGLHCLKLCIYRKCKDSLEQESSSVPMSNFA